MRPSASAVSLLDHRRFEDRLRQAIAQAERTGEQIALQLLDLERSDAGETPGRGAEEKMLAAIAGRLASITRRTDSLLHLGGYTFAVLQRAIRGSEGVTTLARKLLAVASERVLVDGLKIELGAAIGICLHAPSIDSKGMLARAYEALRAAKAEGGFRYHTEGLTESLRARILLDEKLERALRREEFFLEYQPQVSVKNGRVVAFEALLRWCDPRRGVFGPQEFIAVAERSGLIVDLGLWVLEEACRRCREWNRTVLPGVPVAVNLSPAQLKDPAFLERTLRALERVGLEGHLLELELTETVDLESSAAVREALGELRRRGVTLSIDDFGNGYGSLRYLRALPVDKIKIPQEFVRPAATSPVDRAIVDATVELGHRLGLTVVAEGVETPAQLAALRAARCDAAQGFLLGRPAIVPRALRWRSNPRGVRETPTGRRHQAARAPESTGQRFPAMPAA